MDGRSQRVVVYFRSRPSEPGFSDQALTEQRTAVARWLSDNPGSVVDEYIESEIDGMPRPRLADAIAKCKASNASLLIPRAEAIGSGLRFEHRIVSVPVFVAPQAAREIGHVIPCPHNAFAGLSLYFPDYRGMRASPVYLCNNAELQLENLRLSISEVTSKIDTSTDTGSMLLPVVGDPVRANAPRVLPALPPFSAILIDRYDPMIDGEAIASYAISFTARGQQEQTAALVGPGALPSRFIKLS